MISVGFCRFLSLAIILISTAYGQGEVNTVNANVVAPSIPLSNLDTSTSNSALVSNTNPSSALMVPNTVITSHVDTLGRNIPNEGSTISRSITFAFEADPNNFDSRLLFICKIDNRASEQDCRSPRTYDGLSLGTHIFQVRAGILVVEDGITRVVTGNPAIFRWTVVSSTTTVIGDGSQIEAKIEEDQRKALEAQVEQNLAAEETKALSASDTAAQVANTIETVGSLNPPVKPCNKADSNLAIYRIKGTADMHNLLRSTNEAIVPISLTLFLDARPEVTDVRNIILNENNLFLTGRLAVYPGDVQRQEVVNMELTKVDTDCIQAVLTNETIPLGGDTPGLKQPGLLNPGAVNNPIWGPCTVPAGAIGTPQIEGNPAAANKALKTFETIQTTGTSFDDGQKIVLDDASTSATLDDPLSIGQNDPQAIGEVFSIGPNDPTQGPTVQTPVGQGGAVDVAQYVIQGKIDQDQIRVIKNHQPLELTIYNILKPEDLPAQFKAFDTNNIIVAQLQMSPGDTSRWGVTLFAITQLYTSCKIIPFVDQPKSIGVEHNDLTLQTIFSSPNQNRKNSQEEISPSGG
jgi:hypothetical protein